MSNPPPQTTSSSTSAADAPGGDERERAARQEAGALLRAAREAAGRSVAELATQLKVSAGKISALEAGEWDHLHDAAHARGLLRAAAKAVQADPDSVLRPLPPAFVPGTPMLPPKGATLGPARPAEPVGTHSGNHRLVWMALLLIVVALGLLYLPRDDRLGLMLAQVRGLFGHHVSASMAATPAAPGAPAGSAPGSASAAAPATAVASAAGASAAAPAAPAASRPVLAAAASTPTADASAAGTAAAGGAPVASPASAAAQAPAGPALSLSATGKSWVQVRSNSGQVLFTGVLSAGASKDVATRQPDFPLQLVVGNAAQTQVTLGGKAVSLHAGGGNVARLVLPAAGM